MKNSVLVLGAGIAGMRAAAELLQQGFKVCLLEESPRIGGSVEEMERLFPADEHAACALQPLIIDLVNNANAKIFRSAELLSLGGEPGQFSVELQCNSRGGEGGPQKFELNVGAVVVAVGLQESRGDKTRLMAEKLGLNLDEEGNFKRDPTSGHPVRTSREGIFMCGPARDPGGIGESVIQACAAASHAAALLAPVRGIEPTETVENKPTQVKDTDEAKIAVVIDEGKAGFAERLDLDELAEYTRGIPGVAYVEVAPCAPEGKKIEDIALTGDFNRLIVAGPSPIPHEPLYQRHAERAGLNRYLLEMVNLDKQCARVHSSDKAAATQKAKMLMKMGVSRARLLEPLEELDVTITQSCLVVGGSPSGVACAVKLAEMGYAVHIVESESNLDKIPGNDHPFVRPLLARLRAFENVELHGLAKIGEVRGRFGNFDVELIREETAMKVKIGAIVLASQASIEDKSDRIGFEESLTLVKDQDGLYTSTQGILNLLDFSTEGVFNCGPARAVLGIEDSVVDGEAAASRAACTIASPAAARPPTISFVIDENCDGCAYCVDPCPTRSITLLEFMLRSEIKKTVEVSDATCIGCGICMSTCPKDGIEVRHYKPAYFSEMVKVALEQNGDQPVIVGFCCNRCAYPGADSAGSLEIQYPSSVLIIRTVCAGMIHPNIIMDALTGGADGILLCGCHPGNCRSRDGILKAEARAESIELMLEDFGLEPERFRLEHIAASEGRKFAQIVAEMTEQLSALGPNPYRS